MAGHCKMYVPRMCSEGNTMVTVDMMTRHLVSAFLCEDFCNEDPLAADEWLTNSDGNLWPVINVITTLQERLSSSCINATRRTASPGRPASGCTCR